MSVIGYAALGAAGAAVVGGVTGGTARIGSAGAGEYSSPFDDALVGAVAAPLAVGAFAASSYALGNGAEKIGKATWNNKGTIVNGVAGVTGTALEKIGNTGIKGATVVAKVGAGISQTVADTFLTKAAKDSGAMFGFKLNGKGKLLMAGLTMAAALDGGVNQYNQDRQGTPTGVMNSTPRTEPLDKYTANMAEQFGAGGDLVFAMNKNRRG